MSPWAHLRGVLVILHLVAITLLAMPNPGAGVDRRAWADPTVKAELATWRDRVAALGWDLPQEDFEDALHAVAKGAKDGRDALVAPFRPYYLYCGTWQSWRMFVAPHRFPSRLEIAVRPQGGDWQVVYAARSEEADWSRSILDHDRMRSAVFRYAWPTYRGTYTEFTKWVARRAAVDFPDADQVRVRYLKGASPSPEQVRAGEIPTLEPTNPRVLSLRAFRQEAP